MNEKEWIKKAKQGNSHAFASLFQENYPFLVKYFMKTTMNPLLAEELAQETMTKCMEKIHLYNGKAKFSSWLIQIGANLYMDQIRKQKREENYRNKEHLRLLKWQLNCNNEQWNDTLSALGLLVDDIRMAIILKHYYGYSYEEIGNMMRIAPGTVKSRIHYGLKIVRKELGINEG